MRATVFILLALAGCGSAARDASAEQAITSLGKIAAVPASATDVRSAKVENSFSGTYVLRFCADSAAIEVFLSSSPRLKDVTPEQFTSEHQYIPYRETEGNSRLFEMHATFQPRTNFPWFDPAVRVKGRRYMLEQDSRAVYGEVVVDDDAGVVYVVVNRS